MNMGEFLSALKTGKTEPAPICRTLGIECVAFGEGTTTMRLAVDQRFHNPMGTVEGGILGDLADVAMGHAFGTLLTAGESFTTLEMKINFLRPIREGVVTGEAVVLHKGKTVGLVECTVSNAEGKPVAKANSTVMILRGEAAAGR